MTSRQERTDLDERLEEVFRKVQATILDERGYGGPVAHTAEVDGWQLRVGSSDWGDVMIRAVSPTNRIMFEVAPDGVWYGHHFEYSEHYKKWVEVGDQATDGEKRLMADLAERAQWHDEIERKPRNGITEG